MNKQYILVSYTMKNKSKMTIIDSLGALGLREAEADFKKRNDYDKLIKKGDLMVCEVKKYYQ